MDNTIVKLFHDLKIRIKTDPRNSLELAKEVYSIALKQTDNNYLIEGHYLMGLSYWEEGKTQDAEKVFIKAYDLLREDTPIVLKVHVISVLSITYSLRYEKKESYSLAKEAMSYEDQVDDYYCLVSLYTRIGGTYIRLSLYAQALEVLLRAVEIIKDNPTHKDEGYIYSHMSIVQTRMKYYDESITSSKNAEKIFTKIGNQERGIIAVLINRSMAYFFQGNINESIISLENVKEICLKDHERYENSICLIAMNLCSCYSHDKIKKYIKALEYAKLSLEIAEKKNQQNIICLNLSYILKCNAILNKGIPCFLSEKYGTNIDILNHILKISTEVNDLMINQEISKNISEFYVQNNNYKEAYKYQKKLVVLHEKISEKEKDENLFALNIKYETYQRELKLQQLELEKRELKLQQKEELKEINKNLENKVRERTAEILAKNNELEQYAYIVAHDLKEPIRSIVGFSQLIERRAKDELSNKSKELLAFVINASYNMREMVDDLLTFSTIQVEKDNYSKIDLNKLLEKVSLNLRNMIKESDAKIIIGELPKFIIGDSIRIRQLFQNIISNAIKFKSPERTSIIKIKGHNTINGYSFTIKDNGIGIKEEFQEKIFLLFKRLHTKEKFKGSGIGLSVCQKIVKQHGGDIWVTSEYGIGTTFHFTLS